MKKKLPIGIQSLRELREEGHYYADKSGYAVDLAEQGKYYFLSRPRRFGKSLFLDTLKELFEGNAALFKGLAAETRWDWSKKHPVIRISFGSGVHKAKVNLVQRMKEILRTNRERLGIVRPAELPASDVAGNLSALIAQAHLLTGQRVVVLIDEYDKPILDNITDSAIALEMRETLKDLYSVLKDMDEHLRLVFITGVSKFSKVSLFSGLNNLEDITLSARYSALCGYTDEDVDTVFAPELPGLDREEIRRWYNGYNWLGQGVYNPFDMLLLFRNREFRPYWFETGTPTFLIKLLAGRCQFTPDLARTVAEESLLSTFDVDDIPSEALMFQAGYLTIQSRSQPMPGRWVYTLTYPNLEVAGCLNTALLPAYGVPTSRSLTHRLRLLDVLRANDLPALKTLFHAFFASIPNDWYRNSSVAQFEGYYASIFYSHFAAMGLDIRLEDVTNHGRIDMTVLFNGRVFIFEFKVVSDRAQGKAGNKTGRGKASGGRSGGASSKGTALQQIKDRGYADKYRARGEPIHLIGVEFGKDSRNIVGFEVETA
ncbi:MAG: hypothetical protein RJB68_781 [Pseudomonadota bacterium]